MINFNVLFDLDGTLTDPGLGITNSVMHALGKYGVAVKDRSELFPFIGPPLHESFEKFYGFSREEAMRAVAYYREYFAEKGLYENILYDGIKDLLETLRNRGARLAVATSKPEVYAKRILAHFDIEKHFDCVAGSNLDGTRIQKNEVIRSALDRCGIADLSKTVMVGDREHDVIGAKRVGIASVGVLYGYGSRRELEAAGADFIAETVGDIGAVLDRL